MKLSIMDFFRKRDQIRKKSLMKNFVFCAVLLMRYNSVISAGRKGLKIEKFTEIILINPFHDTDLFWYPLKTSENPWCFPVFSGGIERDQWHEMG